MLPEIDNENQIPKGINPQDLEQALVDNPDAQGILITRPNYYGIASSVEDIVKISQKYNVPLLIDEAHGAHFIFHNAFPECGIRAGAELCVQSLHKTMPALTQTAILHGKNNLISREKVEMISSMLQTTSPSYLLMASIDFARDFMERKGYSLYQRLLENINEFNRGIENIPSINRVCTEYKGFETDFSRIVLSLKTQLFPDTQLKKF